MVTWHSIQPQLQRLMCLHVTLASLAHAFCTLRRLATALKAAASA